MNLLPGPVFGLGETTIAGFRPERARLSTAGLRGRVTRVERTGADVYVHLITAHGPVIVRTASSEAPSHDTELCVAVERDALCEYDA